MKRIVIDPGHGGWDPGAIAVDGVPECQFTWQLSKALGDYLVGRYQVEVVYTHEGPDTALADNQVDELRRRAAVANKIEADLLFSIHHDNTGDRSVRGGSLWIWRQVQGSGLGWAGAKGNHTDPKSYPIAQAIVGPIREVLAGLGVPWRWWGDPDGIACADFYLLECTRGPAILLEAFHGSNKDDVAAARRSEFVPTLARAIGDALAAALDLPARVQPGPFLDVPANHWAAEAIARAKELGLMSGHPDGTFGLGQPLKREEAAVLAINLRDRIVADIVAALSK